MLLVINQTMDPVVWGISAFYGFFFPCFVFLGATGGLLWGYSILRYKLSMVLCNNLICFFNLFFPFNLTVCWYNFNHPHILMNAAAFAKNDKVWK